MHFDLSIQESPFNSNSFERPLVSRYFRQKLYSTLFYFHNRDNTKLELNLHFLLKYSDNSTGEYVF